MDCLTDALAACNGNLDLTELLRICSGLCPFLGIPVSLQNAQYLIFQLDTFERVRSVIYPQKQFPGWYFGRGLTWACCRTGAEVEGDDALRYCSIYIDWLMQYT